MEAFQNVGKIDGNFQNSLQNYIARKLKELQLLPYMKNSAILVKFPFALFSNQAYSDLKKSGEI